MFLLLSSFEKVNFEQRPEGREKASYTGHYPTSLFNQRNGVLTRNLGV